MGQGQAAHFSVCSCRAFIYRRDRRHSISWIEAVELFYNDRLVAYIAFQVFARNHMMEGDLQLFININYAILASLVLFPVLGYLIKTKFINGQWVGIALIAFILALTFRVADAWGWFSFGTHFLWHLFGAVAAYCMFMYIYLLNEKRVVVA